MKKKELSTFVFFLFLTLMCSSLSEKYLPVGVMVVLKSSLILKADFAVVVLCKCW